MADSARKPHSLVDTTEGNYLEGTFNYDMPPLIKFDGKLYEEIDGKTVTFDPKEALKRDLVITDTTFRDGQQAREPYTIEQMVKLYGMLSRLGGPNGVIRQTEFFLYTKNDRETLDQCRALGYKFPECTGWIRAVKGDFRLVKEAGLKETGMLTSCSDYHIFDKLKFKSRKECMNSYLEVVAAAYEAGVRPRCHLEDLTRADIDGFVLPFVDELVKLSRSVSKDMHCKVRLCDTMGFGISYPGVELPRSIPKLIYKLNKECGVPNDCLEWHGHNDFHKVHINGGTAWLYGCNAMNGTLLGIGERTGNPPLEGAIVEWIALHGDFHGIDMSVITEIADYFRSIGTDIPTNYPFVGKHFNTTRAGIHAGGLRKNERIYNIFNTEKLLGRPPSVAITDKSGTDAIAIWVNDFLRTKGTADEVNVIKVVKIQKWVMEQYNEHKRLSVISDKELEDKTKEFLPELYAKYKQGVAMAK